jgi:hypothetical protein
MTVSQPRVGARLVGARNARIGTVDAVFADYLLVRSGGLLPVDLYIPRTEVTEENGRLRIAADAATAYERGHRPLTRAPND